jgi:hypothetical protein
VTPIAGYKGPGKLAPPTNVVVMTSMYQARLLPSINRPWPTSRRTDRLRI